MISKNHLEYASNVDGDFMDAAIQQMLGSFRQLFMLRTDALGDDDNPGTHVAESF